MTRNRALVDLDALPDLFPHRVARATELIGLGLSGNMIHTHCRPDGPWQRLAPGVVLLGAEPPTRAERIACALRHAGPGAILTGWDALARHGLSAPPTPGPVHVLVPHGRQVRGDPHTVIERTANPPKPVLCQSFPVAPLPRAAIDTACRLGSPDLVRTLLSEVIRRGRVAPAQLRSELDLTTRRGTALPRRILDEIHAGARSLAEAWARRLVARAGLPQPHWNSPVRAPDGKLLGIVDAWWDDVGLAWDLNSYDFSPPPAAYAENLRRTARLTATGIIVVHTPPHQLRDDPSGVADELRHAHLLATRRPRPQVTAEVAGVS